MCKINIQDFLFKNEHKVHNYITNNNLGEITFKHTGVIIFVLNIVQSVELDKKTDRYIYVHTYIYKYTHNTYTW